MLVRWENREPVSRNYFVHSQARSSSFELILLLHLIVSVYQSNFRSGEGLPRRSESLPAAAP
jgi:hypothetical protein